MYLAAASGGQIPGSYYLVGATSWQQSTHDEPSGTRSASACHLLEVLASVASLASGTDWMGGMSCSNHQTGPVALPTYHKPLKIGSLTPSLSCNQGRTG